MPANAHVAEFVSIIGSKLVITGIHGKQVQTCTLTADARVWWAFVAV
jgi:hypothetical protein